MYIQSSGMACSVGFSSEAACAAMRAGIAGFDELPYLDNSGEPIIGAMVPGLDPKLKREDRHVEMLAMALEDCLSKQPHLDTQRTPLLVGLAEIGRPGGCAQLAGSIVARVEQRLGVRFHPQYSQAIPKGHTAGFEGLRIARELFAKDSSITGALVCGVDSYINARSLLWLDEHWRLKKEGHSDGVIPGEGAATLLVTNSASKTKPDVHLRGLGFAHEKVGILSTEPFAGLGLSEALGVALQDAGAGFHQIDVRISDATGEAYAFKEQATSECRLVRVHRGEVVIPVWHLADTCGDCGAAMCTAHLSITYQAAISRRLPGHTASITGSQVGGDRAAVFVEIIE